MIELPRDMREAIDNSAVEGAPMLVATAGADGMPDMAFKGSFMAWDGDHLAFWERAHGTTQRNLEENPKVCVLYRNAEKRVLWKFFGVAELHRTGAVRDGVMGRTPSFELDRDPERTGVAVVIRIDKVIHLGKVLMEREAVSP
ncbi:MAG: pyridoxamine 5'-phosphate oxidase family protein [Chloroflexi bacterium]|nr:pyridoxamine 5'-phosphate oxidase family protein [Chloroflexota bacterium]